MSEAYAAPETLPWMPFGEGEYCRGGIEWKLLYTQEGDERWTAMFRGPEGAYIFPHIHDDEAEGWMFHGGLQLAPGRVGMGPSWFREEKAAHHPRTTVVGEEACFVITIVGTITWIKEDGSHVKTDAMDARAIWEKQLEEASLVH